MVLVNNVHSCKMTLREKSPHLEFFLVRIFPRLCWIRRDTPHLSIFSSNAEIWTWKTPNTDTFYALWIMRILKQPYAKILHPFGYRRRCWIGLQFIVTKQNSLSLFTNGITFHLSMWNSVLYKADTNKESIVSPSGSYLM